MLIQTNTVDGSPQLQEMSQVVKRESSRRVDFANPWFIVQSFPDLPLLSRRCLKDLGAMSLGLHPFSQGDSQKGARAPLPMVMVVHA